MGDAGLDFLVQPAKDGRITGFEPHNLRAVLRVGGNQRVDIRLRHGRAKALFARVQHHRLAAGQFENFGRDQPVIDHHIRLIEQLAGLVRQKIGVPGTCTDEIDMRRAGLARQMLRKRGVQRALHGGVTLGDGRRAGAEIVIAPEVAARAAEGQGVGHFAKPLADARERAKAGGQLRLQIGLDRAGQHGRCAFCANRNGHRIAVHNGRRDELAAAEVIDDIDHRAICAGNGRGACIRVVIFIGGIGQHRAERITRRDRAGHVAQFARCGPGQDLRIGLGRENGDMGGCLEQQAQFGQRSLAAARQHNAAACKGDKYRKVIHWAAPDVLLQYRKMFRFVARSGAVTRMLFQNELAGGISVPEMTGGQNGCSD